MSTIEKALQKKQLAEKQQAIAEQVELETDTKTSNQLPEESIKAAYDNGPSAKEISAATSGKSQSTEQPFLDLSDLNEHFVTTSERSLIKEEFRTIKRKILNNAFGPLSKTLTNSNIIMVTSANPGEGKTFTAVNLALSIASEQDKTVLLVDADVLRPNVMRTINHKAEDGLMEYLLGEVEDIGEVMYRTSLDTLRIIPAGRSHHLSTELLASEKMLQTVEEFATRYPDRVVIFDTPPMLGINETAVLANLAGQAVIVVEEGKTPLSRVANAVDQLNPDMAKGFVINKSQQSSKEGGYYGYYYRPRDEEK